MTKISLTGSGFDVSFFGTFMEQDVLEVPSLWGAYEWDTGGIDDAMSSKVRIIATPFSKYGLKCRSALYRLVFLTAEARRMNESLRTKR